MKAGIFDPYLDTIGGGERYAMTVTEALLKRGWQVDIFWSDSSIKQKLVQKFSINIDGVNFVSYSPRVNKLLGRRATERGYDFLFYFSDGSIPFMFGKKNILHFQVPFKNVLKKTLINKLKLETIDEIVCNSIFTKNVIDRCLGVSSTVIYPPVDISAIKPLKKENLIISVGRFSQLLQGKRQDILVEAFIQMVDKQELRGWKLILAGGTEIGGKEFMEGLRKKAGYYPIEILENPPFDQLMKLYGVAKIFWTASGYDVDENRDPEKVEHFGITTVEAMAAGCVSVVQGKGGQKEIVEDGRSGFLWTTEEELISRTAEIIKSKELLNSISSEAIIRCRDFSKEKFYDKIYNLI